MQRGDTFIFTDIDSHLWVILSCPKINPQEVLLVNLSTHQDYKDGACILDVQHHEWIKHPSCVMYDYARVGTLSRLEAGLNSGRISLQDPMRTEVLDLIYIGAEESTRLSLDHANILANQGWIAI